MKEYILSALFTTSLFYAGKECLAYYKELIPELVKWTSNTSKIIQKENLENRL